MPTEAELERIGEGAETRERLLVTSQSRLAGESSVTTPSNPSLVLA